jgi:biotin synthesis protein BioG
MEKVWINQQNSSQLLLFFNGWGMDEKPFNHLGTSKDLDVLMVYDYTNLDNAHDLCKDFADYKSVHLVAWSLGVFVAAKVLAGIKFASTKAINGTLMPIDENEGIAPIIFQGTIDSWGEVARIKFNRRMCGTYSKQFNVTRSIESQKSELISLKEQIINSSVPENIFQQATISLNDKIFTRQAQERHWRRVKIPIRIIDETHCFFSVLKKWEDLLI